MTSVKGVTGHALGAAGALEAAAVCLTIGARHAAAHGRLREGDDDTRGARRRRAGAAVGAGAGAVATASASAATTGRWCSAPSDRARPAAWKGVADRTPRRQRRPAPGDSP